MIASAISVRLDPCNAALVLLACDFAVLKCAERISCVRVGGSPLPADLAFRNVVERSHVLGGRLPPTPIPNRNCKRADHDSSHHAERSSSSESLGSQVAGGPAMTARVTWIAISRIDGSRTSARSIPRAAAADWIHPRAYGLPTIGRRRSITSQYVTQHRSIDGRPGHRLHVASVPSMSR